MKLLRNITCNKYIVLFLLFVSIFVVFYQFDRIPKNLAFDELEFAKLALSLDRHSYTPYSMLATGHSTLYFYIILFSFKLFGINTFALRFPAAFFGAVTPLIFYFILKQIYTSTVKNLPCLLTFLFITMRWYFNFARFGFEVTFLLFLELSSVYFLFKYFKNDQTKNIIFSALLAGLAYNSYQPGRIFFILPFLFLALHMIKLKIRKEMKIKKLSLFIIPFLIMILPLTLYLTQHKDIRLYQQFYPDNHEMTISEKVSYFTRNLQSTILIFNVKGDVNGRHNYPNKAALNPIAGLLFVFGMIIALKNIKERNNQLFVFYFFISLTPTLLTYPWENPNMLRTFTVIPSAVYFIGVTLNSYIQCIEKRNLRFKPLILPLLLIIVVISSFYELRTYYLYQAPIFDKAFEIKTDVPLTHLIKNEKK